MQVKNDREAGSSRSLFALVALILTVCVPPGLVALWARPRPALPLDAPPLHLARADIDAALAEDASRAADAPPGPLADARRRLYHEANLAEVRGGETRGDAESRQQRLVDTLARLSADDETVRARVRAADLADLDAALAGTLEDDARDETIGDFVRMMDRYRLADRGRQIAPRFVVRSVFKARWNAVHGLELTESFLPVERRAYFGWLALHAEGAPWPRRLSALQAYGEAGGQHVAEARARALCVAGLPLGADVFEAALDEHFTWRLRNHGIACLERPE